MSWFLYDNGLRHERVNSPCNCQKSLLMNRFISPYRSSRPEMFCKKSVLRNFAKFTIKHLCKSPFFNKVAGLRPAALFKKKLRHMCFPVNFANFQEHLFYRTPLVAASLRTHFRKKSEVSSKDHLHMPTKIIKLKQITVVYQSLFSYSDVS